ncbi:hypothetical protein V8C86DRAFT_2972459 [Haematococcus lacustris]
MRCNAMLACMFLVTLQSNWLGSAASALRASPLMTLMMRWSGALLGCCCTSPGLGRAAWDRQWLQAEAQQAPLRSSGAEHQAETGAAGLGWVGPAGRQGKSEKRGVTWEYQQGKGKQRRKGKAAGGEDACGEGDLGRWGDGVGARGGSGRW